MGQQKKRAPSNSKPRMFKLFPDPLPLRASKLTPSSFPIERTGLPFRKHFATPDSLFQHFPTISHYFPREPPERSRKHNTSAQVSQYKWEPFRDANWHCMCMCYLQPREGRAFAKVSRWKWEVFWFIAILSTHIGVRGWLDFPDLSGTGDSQRNSRESIRANHSQLKPLFL